MDASYLDFGKRLFKHSQKDGIFDLAAQLAFYFLLSLFPFLIFSITLLAYFDFSQEQILELVYQYAPPETFSVIQKNLLIGDGAKKGLLSFGILFTMWSASNALNAIIRALNKAYNVKESRHFIIARGLAVILSFAMIFVIVVALLLPVFGEMLWRFLMLYLNLPDSFSTVFSFIRWALSFLIIFAVFVVIYFFAPNKRIGIRDVIKGSIFSTVIWQLLSLAFSYYVSNFGNFTATYGSLGGVIVLMLWFYLTGLIIVLGGEINALSYYYRNRNS
ncbi:YihY/virulence factor BrkB family protein [Pseudalkalibacillus caeni]|uniref:YihY/virulence factor BrkB family protein n=1 Tax=Exobacillus caeni TaxID=2574798 RepID=UPI001FEA3068|nr:YihY/virulence factor BrkB family protein [Pseudalkalibacillus caeni]